MVDRKSKLVGINASDHPHVCVRLIIVYLSSVVTYHKLLTKFDYGVK